MQKSHFLKNVRFSPILVSLLNTIRRVAQGTPTMVETKRSTILRKLLSEKNCLITPFGACAHHAQLAENAGFKAFGISGSKVSGWIYGIPDAGILTQTELVEAARNICGAVKIPVIADADTGYGNAIQVRRTVELLIKAGAAACFIEDQTSPKRCGNVKGKQLISIEEAVGKYRAACDVRDELDPDFVVIARTDARGAVGGGFDEVIKRVQAYAETGVDMIYAEALQTREEIREVRAAVPDKLFRATEKQVKPPLRRQEKIDLDICMTSIHIANVATVAMYDFLADLKARAEDAWIDFDEKTKDHPMGGHGLFDLTGFPEIVRLEKKYLPADDIKKYEADTLGLYDPEVGRKGAVKAAK
jgi:2-methylisocitrate lyase-like PEP mutase family enzyme